MKIVLAALVQSKTEQTTAVTEQQFKKWDSAKQSAWLKAHPNSKFGKAVIRKSNTSRPAALKSDRTKVHQHLESLLKKGASSGELNAVEKIVLKNVDAVWKKQGGNVKDLHSVEKPSQLAALFKSKGIKDSTPIKEYEMLYQLQTGHKEGEELPVSKRGGGPSRGPSKKQRDALRYRQWLADQQKSDYYPGR